MTGMFKEQGQEHITQNSSGYFTFFLEITLTNVVLKRWAKKIRHFKHEFAVRRCIFGKFCLK